LNHDNSSALNSANPLSLADDAHFEEGDEEEVIVPATQESLQVVVLESPPEVDEVVVDLLPNEVDNQHCNVAAGHNYGGFYPPTESEGNEY
jgi:hypothetical protein